MSDQIERRHYGIVGDEPDEELSRDNPAPRALADGEFVCPSCFLRRSPAQLTDPAQHICVDCAANEA